MSKWIDADALIEAMGEEPYVWTDSAEEIAERNQWLTDMGIIENAPTIDAVSVVRCKCDFGKCHEQGDTLYEPSDWDGGIGFDYIRDIKYCPLCGGLLDGEREGE